MIPKSGDVIYVSRAASVQFGEPFLFRVIRVQDWPTYYGWKWIEGYQLDRNGDAIERRNIYVQPDGLKLVQIQLTARRPRNQRAPGTPAPASRNRRRAEWDAVRPEPGVGGNRR